MSRMADRNVSKSPPGSLSPDVFRSHPPSFEAAGQQHSGIGARLAVLRRRTRPLARRGSVAGAHAHARTYARVPGRRHPPRTPARPRPRTRPPGRRARVRPPGPRAPALRPSCRRHDARKSRDLGPRLAPSPPLAVGVAAGDGHPGPPSTPSIGPPGEIGHRFAQEAVGTNATPRPKMERWRNFRG